MWGSFKFVLAIAICLPYAFVPSYGYAPKPELVTRQQGENGSFLRDYPGQTKLPSLEELKRLNATNGTFLNVNDIQADILIGMKKPKELFFFYAINDPKKFKAVLKKLIYPLVTSTAQIICTSCPQPDAMLNVAWTASGLQKLNVFDNLLDGFFNNGQVADAPSLGDPGLGNWVPGLRSNKTHGVFLIASDDWIYVDNMINQIISWLGTSITELHRLKGAHRSGAMAGHEHFGFLDGFTQPAVAGFATTLTPGQSLIFPGTILTNEPGDPLIGSRPAWTKDGSFLAFRQLQQFVPEFDTFLKNNALSYPGLTAAQGADLLGARMMGRWKSGTPIDLAPVTDIPSIGPDPMQNNNFDFDHPLPFNINSDQTFCPWSAHIRKTRPRADQGNANIGNQIMRAGIPYGDDVTAAEIKANKTRNERGLAFVSYQSDIGQGYRFQQVAWANDPNFISGKSDPTPGWDPIFGQNGGGTRFSSGLDPLNPNKDIKLIDFVVSRGGEYFFSPSMAAILNPIAV